MKRARIAIPLCFTILAFAALAVSKGTTPQDSKSKATGPVSGTWQCTAHGGPNGDTNFTLYLSQDKEEVTGSVSSPLGDADISSATFKDGKLEIHINGGDTTYTLSAKLDSGQLSGGQWSSDGGEKGTWEGKRGADQQGK